VLAAGVLLLSLISVLFSYGNRSNDLKSFLVMNDAYFEKDVVASGKCVGEE